MDIKNESCSKSNMYIIESEELSIGNNSGIGYAIFDHMMKNSNQIAQYDVASNTEEIYGTLLKKSINTAISLKSLNLGEEAIIGICSLNHVDTCVPIIAAQFLGYKVIAYDCLLSESDLSLLLSQIPPSVVFVDEEHVEKMETALLSRGTQTEVVVFGRSDKYKTFNKFHAESRDVSFKPVKLESSRKTALIMFSSGTTGLPKGICLSNESLLDQAVCFVSRQNLTSESIFLNTAHYNWITAQVILIACIISGASRVLCPINVAWDAINKYKVTHMSCSPYVSSVVMNQAKQGTVQNRTLKSLITSGSRLPSKVLLNLSKSFPEALVIQSYGQTEASGWIAMFQWHKKEDCALAKKNPDSVGKLLPGYRCKVVDHITGEIVGPNQVGELRFKSRSFFMIGYYKKDSSDTFDEEGWLRTGDLGYYDENHCLYIVGRSKELLKYRGFHISPQKLEKILESHPGVERAVVIGVPHTIDESHIKGVVVLKDGQEKITAEQIRSFFDDQVEDRLKLRGGVQIVENIPVNSTGKPNRRALTEMIEQGKC